MVRRQSHPATSRSGGKLLVLLLVVLCFFGVGVSSSFGAAAPSPNQQNQGQKQRAQSGGDAAATDLICHTDNAAECYPRVFQATDEFQRVHADQDLPPGLHVRLNVWTGEKEAKRNNVSEDAPAGLEGLPVDQSVVLVDQPLEQEQEQVQAQAQAASIPEGAPAYDPVGLVKKPEGAGDDHGGGEAQAFYDAVAVVKGVAAGQAGGGKTTAAAASVTDAERARFADALEQLDEFAHDIYYGVKLAEDADATRALLCLMSGGGGSVDNHATAQQAAAIVAAALQNNPAALREVERVWDQHKMAVCRPGGSSKTASATTLGESIFGPYCPADESDGIQSSPAWVRSRLLAVNGLLKSEAIMRDFLAGDGLTEVLRLLVEQTGTEYDAARTRAANLVVDNFLDAGMGADVSLWPENPEPKDEASLGRCGDGSPAQAHCWDHHVERLAKAHKGDKAHWSVDLWRRLQERKEGAGKRKETVGHGEL